MNDSVKSKRSSKSSNRSRVRPPAGNDGNFPVCLLAQEFSTISNHSCTRIIGKNERVYSQGEADDNLYVVDSGVVKLTRITAQGNTLVTDILGKKMIFGNMCATEIPNRSESAIAMEGGVLHVVNKSARTKLEKNAPDLTLKLKDMIESRRQRAEDRIVDLLFRSVEQRVAKMLIHLLSDFGIADENGHSLNILVTHQVYAGLVASTRETVTAVLNRMRKNGILDYSGKRLVVPSMDKLQEIAQ